MNLPFLYKAKSILFNESLIGRFNKGAFWILVSTVGLQGSNLLVTVFLARIFGQAGYGGISLVISTFALMGEVAGLGFGLTTTKYLAEFRKTNPSKAGRIIGLSLLVSVSLGIFFSIILLLFPGVMATSVMDAPALSVLLQVGALQVLFTAAMGVVLGILSGLEAFKGIGLSNATRGIVSLVLIGVGVYLWGSAGAVLAITIAAGIGLLMALSYLRKSLRLLHLQVNFKGCLQEVPIILTFSLPAFLSNISVIGAVWLTNIILVNYLQGFSELGQLNVANQWKTLLLLMPNIIAQVLLPLLSSELSNKEKTPSHMLAMFQSITVLVIFPVGTFFMFYAEYVLLIYGSEFQENSEVLIGTAWSVIMASSGSVLGAFVQSSGRMWIGFFTNITYGFLIVLFTFFFAGTYGANAIAFGSGIAYIFINLMNLLLLRKYLDTQLVRQITLAVLLSIFLVIICLLVPAPLRKFTGVAVMVIMALVVYQYVISSEVRSSIAQAITRILPAKS